MSSYYAIAAMARNRIIGANNRLPWHLPGDLRRFKAMTLGHPIIMGRKTFDSLGKPLPQRTNIVLSRQDFKQEGIEVVPGWPEAKLRAEARNPVSFVIGGAEIYRLAWKDLSRIYLTVIDLEIDGDAVFPTIDEGEFRLVEQEAFKLPIAHRYTRWDRL